MRRLLHGATGRPAVSKREEVTFSEDGWARMNTNNYGYSTGDDRRAETGTAEEESQYYPEGDYAENEPDDDGVDYAHYYTAAEREKEVEEGEAEGYGEEGDPAQADSYEYPYETGENAQAAEEADVYDEHEAEGEEEVEPYAAEEEGNEEEVAEHEASEGVVEGADTHLSPYSLSQIAQRVLVRHIEGKGRCLYTRNALDPGEVIFIEKPVLVAIPSLNQELWELLTALNNEAAFDLPPIWHLAALCSMTLLGEEGFKICMDKWVPETDREPSEDVLRVCEYIEGDIDPRVYERMLLVWRYNSFGHHTETHGLVLYNRISMMAHSCKATACWHYGEEDAFVLRARVSLQRGDEITISYIGDDELFKSTNVRREKVQGWLFTCQCARCSSPVDPARGFRCPTCGNGSMFFKTEDDVTTSCPCTVCGTMPSEETIEKYITFESAYAERLAETNKSDMPDAEMVYEQATRVFTRHWILFQLDTILFEGYRAAGDYESAYVHQAHRLNYVTEVLPLASYSLAWLFEEMGDVLWSRIQAKGKPYADSRLRIAGRHFEDAYNLLYILCGPDHEYTTAAASKRNKIDELTTAI